MAKRRYDPDGPHPFGFTLEDVPKWILIEQSPSRATFTAETEESKARNPDEVVSQYVFLNWREMVNKFKTFMKEGIVDGFPVLLDGVPVGLNEAGRRLHMHPATLRRKLEQGIVVVRGHSMVPDEVVLDFCYESIKTQREHKRALRQAKKGGSHAS